MLATAEQQQVLSPIIMCTHSASFLSLLSHSGNTWLHVEEVGDLSELPNNTRNCFEQQRFMSLIFYRFPIFQPADLWFRFPTGYAGHIVVTMEVFLSAADALHPLRISCNEESESREECKKMPKLLKDTQSDTKGM